MASVPTAACLINNYNYGAYVCDAVASALTQTLPFDEIIVVDDGSTDDSLHRLSESFGQEPRVRVISKPNGGQLSAFNRGFTEASSELLFFLDADDLYDSKIREEVSAVYAANPERDMVLLPVCLFGATEGVDCAWSDSLRKCTRFEGKDPMPEWPQHGRSMDLEGGVAEAWVEQMAVYAPTSGITLRRDLASRFLPLACESAWRIRADFCLTIGAALADAKRYYLHRPLVHYRVHGSNAFYGTAVTKERMKAMKESTGILMAELAGLIMPDVLAQAIITHYKKAPWLGKRFRKAWKALGRFPISQTSSWAWRAKYLWGRLARG